MNGKRKRISTNTIDAVLQDEAKKYFQKLQESKTAEQRTLHLMAILTVQVIARRFELEGLYQEIARNLQYMAKEQTENSRIITG